ncbi:MAG: hypothetical protein LBD68_01085 [Zoogloeaceae bacterium]|jgi:hypothetical protein|nr:hypothetical protein [Zoogloeaceae bacterium]
MRSAAISVFPVCLRRLALWVGGAFALGIVLQAASMTFGAASAEFVEVCAGTGMQRVLFAPTTDDAPLPVPDNAPHCPLCIMMTDDAAPPAATFVFLLPELAAARHLRRRADGTTANSPDLRHAPPRAPPSFA